MFYMALIVDTIRVGTIRVCTLPRNYFLKIADFFLLLLSHSYLLA